MQKVPKSILLIMKYLIIMRRRRLLISLNVSFNIMLSTSKFQKKKLFRSDFTAHVKSLNAYYSKPTLCDLGTFCTKRFNYKVDDGVLVYDESALQGKWPLGRRVEIFPDHKTIVFDKSL